MRFPMIPLAALFTLAAPAATAAPAKSPEAELAAMTAGRVAGPPVDCITLQRIRTATIIRSTAIVYEMNDGTRYVNRPVSGQGFLDPRLALVTDTHTSQLCSVDIVRLLDTSIRMEMGSVGLGKFVPYPRPPRPQG